MLGVASADPHQLMAIKGSKSIISSTQAVLDIGYAADFEYHTEYDGGPYTDSDAIPAPQNYNYHQYGLYFQTNVDVKMHVEFLQWYKYDIKVTAKPFKVSPLNIWAIWYRPESSSFSDFDVDFYGSSWLELLTVKTKIIEHKRTCKVSIWDYLKDATNNHIIAQGSDCTYNDDYEVKYMDPYWKLDFGKKLLPQGFLDKFYGEQQIYNWWVL